MTTSPIYLDNNATTMVHPEVLEAMVHDYRDGLGNPSSSHGLGRRARRLLADARDGIAELIGAKVTGRDPDQILFTSGGTEANNLAIRGLTSRNAASSQDTSSEGASLRGTSSQGDASQGDASQGDASQGDASQGDAPQGDRGIVVSAVEHPSVLGAAEYLRNQGVPIYQLPVNLSGIVSLDDLNSLLERPVDLVSVMLANHETGVLQPVREIAAICRQRGVLTHTDAVQVVGKLPVNFRELDVDALSFAAHKFHGPAGIGGLVVRHSVSVRPILCGGFQQLGLRPGTEPVVLVRGMLRALEAWRRECDDRQHRLYELRERLAACLRESCAPVIIHGESAPRLPHVLNVAFPGVDRQALVMALDTVGVCCSTGSACASGSNEPSPVLRAMGLSSELLWSSIRISLSALTTEVEVQESGRRIANAVNDLRRSQESRRGASPPRTAAIKSV